MGKIKSIRQKNGNTFDTPIPFGADGINIDMESDLNLEEELKIGGLEKYNINKPIITTIVDESEKQIEQTVTSIGGTYNGDNNNIISYEITERYNLTDAISQPTTVIATYKGKTKRIIISENENSGITSIDTAFS